MSTRIQVAASLRILAQRFEAGEVVAFNVSWINQDMEPTTLCWPGSDHVHRLCLGEAMSLSKDVLTKSWGDPSPHSRELSLVTHRPDDDDGSG